MFEVKNSYSLNNISSLKNLSTLALFCEYGNSSPFPSLEFVNLVKSSKKLWLDRGIEKLPCLFPSSITIMVLIDSELMENVMPILGKLSSHITRSL